MYWLAAALCDHLSRCGTSRRVWNCRSVWRAVLDKEVCEDPAGAVRDDARAKLRSSVKRLMVKYKYPPDKQREAIKLVIEQVETMAMRVEVQERAQRQ